MAQLLDVYVVTITHRHGLDVSAFETHDEAVKFIADYAREWWEHEIPSGYGKCEDMSDNDVIVNYFEHVDEEFYDLTKAELKLTR